MPSPVARGLQIVLNAIPRPVADRLWRFEQKHPGFKRMVRRALRPVQTADATISRGAGAGLRFNATDTYRSYVLGTVEPDVQDALARLLGPGDVFYDVGASIGFFTVIGARLVGPGGKVVAIDANAATLNPLRHNVALNDFANVTVMELALGDHSGTGVLSGSPETDDDGSEQLVWGSVADATPADAGPTVRIATLDELIAQGAPVPTLVKLDIEGAETAALPGMARTLREHRPTVLCEIHGTHAEVQRLLTEAGYEVSMVEGVEDRPDDFFHVLAQPAPA